MIRSSSHQLVIETWELRTILKLSYIAEFAGINLLTTIILLLIYCCGLSDRPGL